MSVTATMNSKGTDKTAPIGGMNLDEFKKRLDATRVECKVLTNGSLCGHKDYSLVEHLASTHKLSTGQYKKLYGGNQRVVSPIISEYMGRIEKTPPPSTVTLEDLILPFTFDKSRPTEELERIGNLFGPIEKEQEALLWPEDPYFQFTDNVKAIAFAMERAKNLYMEGPTGCGKTAEIIQSFAKAKRPIRRMNMNGEVTVNNFLGQTLRHSAVDGGGTYYRYGALPLAMKGGYPLLLDEIDYMPPNIAAVCNPVLEGERKLYLPDLDEMIEAKPGFCMFATANTGGKGDMNGVYTGTEILNTAFLDRFPLKLLSDYLPKAKEVTMLCKRFPKLDKKLVTTMTDAANEVRSAFKQGEIAITFSTRKLIDYFEQYEVFGHETAIGYIIGNWLTDPAEYDTISKVFERKGTTLPKR